MQDRSDQSISIQYANTCEKEGPAELSAAMTSSVSHFLTPPTHPFLSICSDL